MYVAQGADGVLRMSCCVRKILLVGDLTRSKTTENISSAE
jgi:hypothetical protein